MAGYNSFKAFNAYSELPISVGFDVNYTEFGKNLLNRAGPTGITQKENEK